MSRGGDKATGSRRPADARPPQRAARVVIMWIAVAAVITALSYSLWPSHDDAIVERSSRNDVIAEIEPPSPDTSGFQRLVRERIAERRATVVANPASAQAWGRLGMAFDVHNLVSEAAVCYAQAERIDNADFRWPYMLAICLPESDPADVALVLSRARALNPDYAPLNLRLAQALFRAGDKPSAALSFQNALTTNPNSTHALVGLAMIALAEKDFQNARLLLERAIRIRPSHGEAYRLLTRVYRALNLTEQSKAAAVAGSRFASKTPMLDPARSEVMLEGATVAHLVRQASLLRRDGRHADAVRKLRQALEVRPDEMMAHFQLGLALFFGLDRRDEGLSELREAVRLDPSFPDAQRALREAESLAGSGRP